MKKKLLALLFIVSLFASCTEDLFITGTVENMNSGTIYLQKFDSQRLSIIDSAQIIDGKFGFSKVAELPELYALTLDATKGSYLVFLDKNPVTIKFDASQGHRNTEVVGSELQDLFIEYEKQRGRDDIGEFIKAHPASLVSAFVLLRDFSHRLSAEEMSSNIQLLDKSLLNTLYVKILQDMVASLQSVEIGKKAPDFTLNDTQGNAVKFSDNWGDGYILLDFWAAWCGPCRRENPNIVEAYKKYKDKGFTVYGVSLDRTEEDWLKAIADDNLTWMHVSDLKFWDCAPAKLYSVRSIPASFLIDKNGIIVAKNLRGEDLHKKLEELLMQ